MHRNHYQDLLSENGLFNPENLETEELNALLVHKDDSYIYDLSEITGSFLAYFSNREGKRIIQSNVNKITDKFGVCATPTNVRSISINKIASLVANISNSSIGRDIKDFFSFREDTRISTEFIMNELQNMSDESDVITFAQNLVTWVTNYNNKCQEIISNMTQHNSILSQVFENFKQTAHKLMLKEDLHGSLCTPNNSNDTQLVELNMTRDEKSVASTAYHEFIHFLIHSYHVRQDALERYTNKLSVWYEGMKPEIIALENLCNTLDPIIGKSVSELIRSLAGNALEQYYPQDQVNEEKFIRINQTLFLMQSILQDHAQDPKVIKILPEIANINTGLQDYMTSTSKLPQTDHLKSILNTTKPEKLYGNNPYSSHNEYKPYGTGNDTESCNAYNTNKLQSQRNVLQTKENMLK